jgi:hypothetical protein
MSLRHCAQISMTVFCKTSVYLRVVHWPEAVVHEPEPLEHEKQQTRSASHQP